MDQQILNKILEAGAQAPSGSNSQPWKFKISGNEIQITALPEKDHPILNFRNRGTWLAHGALIENLIIAASNFGFKTNVQLFPLNPNTRVTAKIQLVENPTQPKDKLFESIFKRATNRKPYSKQPLSEAQKNALASQTQKTNGIGYKLIEDTEKIKAIAEASCANEILMLENKNLHKLFIEELVWTKNEETTKKTGLFIKTMGISSGQEKALRLFKYWPIMRIFNFLGVPELVAKTNYKTYSSSPAVAAIITNGRDDDFLTAGMAMQRLWLEATNLGLSCHLMTGVLFLQQAIVQGGFVPDTKHAGLINDANEKIYRAAEVSPKDKIIALLMRIGKADKPSALSSKFPINQLIE